MSLRKTIFGGLLQYRAIERSPYTSDDTDIYKIISEPNESALDHTRETIDQYLEIHLVRHVDPHKTIVN
jgi:hypothetical protein